MSGKPYKTGERAEVLRKMARYAIRDQEGLIAAYTPNFGEPDETAKQVIAEAKDAIADFKRLAKTASTQST